MKDRICDWFCENPVSYMRVFFAECVFGFLAPLQSIQNMTKIGNSKFLNVFSPKKCISPYKT